MFQSLFPIIFYLLAGWFTQTNAYGFGVSRAEVSSHQNGFGNAISSASTAGSIGSTALATSLAGINQEQIDSQLSGLATGDVITINNVRYMALRTETDAGQTGRRDVMILVQVDGHDSRPGIDSFQSYASDVSRLQDVPASDPSVGTDRAGQSYNAPNNRQNINVGVAVDASAGSYSAPYSTATNRQEDAVVNGVAGVNDPSSLSSYSSSTLMAANDRQSSGGQDHSPSYFDATTGSAKILPNESSQYGRDYADTIPGEAGRDYQILSNVGSSSFNCNGRRQGGYYADVESSCQVYHVCALGKRFSFLCPNGTLFDQRAFVCKWWFDVDCASSANYYNLNDLIGIARVVKNGVSFASDGQPATSVPSQKATKHTYGPPPLPAVQPALIGPTIKRPSDGLASIQAAMATSTY
ncbi:uncharacterized protein LOC130687475 [Daphnia carinata]|uniref:uncharacterized protein LOC130687475 n=1 Tax=Daphnia carinata TaxID=120202 RepID=UPI00257CD571|nr:uncharacterized protein LOC130687475 [Daphnia carinata]